MVFALRPDALHQLPVATRQSCPISRALFTGNSAQTTKHFIPITQQRSSFSGLIVLFRIKPRKFFPVLLRIQSYLLQLQSYFNSSVCLRTLEATFPITAAVRSLTSHLTWCSRYRRRKWTRRHEFKSWTRLIAFHIALIPLGKV